MADNYLEKRYEEVFGSGGGGSAVSLRKRSIDKLLAMNRSFRSFNAEYAVHPLQLEAMVRVNALVASGMNAQRLRFRIVAGGPEAEAVLSLIHLGAALPDVELPPRGHEPGAFIVVCSTVGENPTVCIDLGISLQSMLLKAVDLNLGGVIVRNFDRHALKEALSLPLEPLAVLAVGKPDEQVRIVQTHDGDSLSYYRKDGVHYVPKLALEDIIL